MSRRYAADTTVSAERTQIEIQSLLLKHGASARAVGVDDATSRAFVMFSLGGRQIRVEVLLHPTGGAPTSTPRRWRRWSEQERRHWQASQREQRARSTWRGLLLLLRAKLEAIEGGYSSVEREFLADVMLPGGRSVGQLVSAAVAKAYLTDEEPRLLLPSSGDSVT